MTNTADLFFKTTFQHGILSTKKIFHPHKQQATTTEHVLMTSSPCAPKEESSYTSNNDDMPVWIDDYHLDQAWLLRKINHVANPSSLSSLSMMIAVQDVSNQGRQGTVPRHGGTLRLTLSPSSSSPDDNSRDDEPPLPQFLIMKQISTCAQTTLS